MVTKPTEDLKTLNDIEEDTQTQGDEIGLVPSEEISSDVENTDNENDNDTLVDEKTDSEEDSEKESSEESNEEDTNLLDGLKEDDPSDSDEVVEVVDNNPKSDEDFFDSIPVDAVDPSVKLFKAFESSFEPKIAKDAFAGLLLNSIRGGKKTVYNKTVRENRIFENEYIRMIENAYPSICKIMRDPKKNIRYDEEVVQVEKARKVNSATIRHLASHTQLIKKIEKNGDVIPAKVLTTFAEEELAIYENRFIKSLVQRVDKFIEHRHGIIADNLESFQSDRIKVNNIFKLDKKEVNITIDIAVKKEIEESMRLAQETFDRLTMVRDQYRGLKSTEFMRTLAKARPVLPPIMKTNIILHNPDFKIAYALWLYLDRYDGLGFDLSVRERSHAYDDELSEDVDNIMAVTFAAAMHNRRIGQFSFKKSTYKEAIKKRVREEKSLGDELTLKPGNYQIEKNAINEFYLQETAKYFKNSLKTQQKEGVGDSQSLRVVYKQMLEIIDNIYPSVFDARETQLDDVGAEFTLEQRLEMVKRRQQVLRIVREQKELNLARMDKLEEKAKKEMLQIENKLSLAAERARLREQREREREEKILAIQREREEAKKQKEEEKAKRLAEIQKEKDKQIADKQKAKDKIEAKKVRQKERDKVKAAEHREKMKTSKRRNIRPRKRKMI